MLDNIIKYYRDPLYCNSTAMNSAVAAFFGLFVLAARIMSSKDIGLATAAISAAGARMLVFNPGYSFFWPLSAEKPGIGVIGYDVDWYGVADTEVLIIGLTAVILCAVIRTAYEGRGWVRRMVNVR